MSNINEVQFYLIEEFCKPIQATPGSACSDLVAREIKIERRTHGYDDTSYMYNVITVSLGICSIIPEHLRADLLPRSSINKTGLVMCNSKGIIDSDYRDEWKIKFYDYKCIYSAPHDLPFQVGERVAQFKIEKKEKFTEVYITKEQLEQNKTSRDGGFGSTGK